MKKLLCLLLCALLPALGGCGGVYANYREVEQLHLVQTLGLDAQGEGLRLSLAGEEQILSGDGTQISAAARSLRESSREKVLFTGHLQHILLGEEAVGPYLESTLDYIARSPDLRLDLPVFALRGGRAEETLRELADAGEDVSSLLAALEQQLESRGAGPVLSAKELLENLAGAGCTLISALAPCPSAEDPSLHSLTPTGYALYANGTLTWLDEGEAMAVGLLTGCHGLCQVTVHDARGRPASLELELGKTAVEPVWREDGSLEALDLTVQAEAVVLEADADAALADLNRALEDTLAGRIGRVLERERSLGLDFLGLGERAERAAPLRWRRAGQTLEAQLEDLAFRITVRSLLRHGNDLEGEA